MTDFLIFLNIVELILISSYGDKFLSRQNYLIIILVYFLLLVTIILIMSVTQFDFINCVYFWSISFQLLLYGLMREFLSRYFEIDFVIFLFLSGSEYRQEKEKKSMPFNFLYLILIIVFMLSFPN